MEQFPQRTLLTLSSFPLQLNGNVCQVQCDFCNEVHQKWDLLNEWIRSYTHVLFVCTRMEFTAELMENSDQSKVSH